MHLINTQTNPRKKGNPPKKITQTMLAINGLDIDLISVIKTLVSFVYDIISRATLSILLQQTSQT